MMKVKGLPPWIATDELRGFNRLTGCSFVDWLRSCCSSGRTDGTLSSDPSSSQSEPVPAGSLPLSETHSGEMDRLPPMGRLRRVVLGRKGDEVGGPRRGDDSGRDGVGGIEEAL